MKHLSVFCFLFFVSGVYAQKENSVEEGNGNNCAGTIIKFIEVNKQEIVSKLNDALDENAIQIYLAAKKLTLDSSGRDALKERLHSYLFDKNKTDDFVAKNKKDDFEKINFLVYVSMMSSDVRKSCFNSNAQDVISTALATATNGKEADVFTGAIGASIVDSFHSDVMTAFVEKKLITASLVLAPVDKCGVYRGVIVENLSEEDVGYPSFLKLLKDDNQCLNDAAISVINTGCSEYFSYSIKTISENLENMSDKLKNCTTKYLDNKFATYPSSKASQGRVLDLSSLLKK